MFRKLLGLAPQPTPEGAYTPSPFSLKLATSPETNYTEESYPPLPPGQQPRILMVCTEEQHLVMANGKKFSTGNHPVEMLVPMLHFERAGLGVEVFTLTGRPAQIEHWAMPKKDERVLAIYARYEAQFSRPRSLAEYVAQGMPEGDFVAVFIPGGHGAMLGLPESRDLCQLLHAAAARDWFVLSICHGPAALLAAEEAGKPETFLYRGYKMAAFPDAVDRQTPLIGYMPGYLTWQFGRELQQRGVTLVNKKADKTCQV
ncbi:MAG: protein deglycase HchA, partial [Bacteroidetes bacterium]